MTATYRVLVYVYLWVALFATVRYALEALYVGEVVEYKQLFEIQVGVKQVSLGCCCCFVATGG